MIGAGDAGVYVFDGGGDLLRRIDREGDGPGEIRWVHNVVVGPGDSLIVFDNGVRRASVFDPTYRFVRSTQLPFSSGGDPALLPDGRYVVNGSGSGTLQEGGHAVHVLDGSKVVSSFSRYPALKDDGSLGMGDSRQVTTDGRGVIWVADRHKYFIEGWTPSGVLIDSIRREPEWFTGTSIYGIPLMRSPGSHIQDIHVDASGRLWVVLWRPTEDWRGAWGDLADERIVNGEVQARDRPRMIELYSTMIEVFDLSTGEMLVSLRWPGVVLAMLADTRLAVLTEDLYGVPYVDLWDVVLANPDE